MKILIFNTLYYPHKVGGAEVSVQILAEDLSLMGHNVRVITLHDKKIIKKTKINGVEVHYLPLKNIYWPFGLKGKVSLLKKFLWHILDNYNPFMKYSISHEIEDFNPDVVHTNNLAGFSVCVWSLAKKQGVKVVHTARDYYLFHPNSTLFKKGIIQNGNDLDVKIWSYIKKKQSKNVDFFIGISDFIKNFYIEHGFFSECKTIFIYNSVKKIEKKNIKNKVESIGFIGGLTVEKGFDVYCDIAKKYKNIYKFCAAGKFKNNTEYDFLEQKAKNSDVVLLGFLSFEDFINQVDAVILPIKWNEPFGRVIVECALSNIFVYTNFLGGVQELQYYLSNVLSLEQFSGSIHNLTTSNLTDRFDVRICTEQYITVFEDLIS